MTSVRRHSTGTWPDAAGHFGPYGGRYVPETLMEPLREIEAAYDEARHDPAFEAEYRGLLRDYVGRPDAARPRRPPVRAPRLPRPPQARGPVPHRRPQDQQRARPGAAREADGQDARGRRDGSRASTASRRPPCAPSSASTASSTWAPRTWRARPRTSRACGCSGPRCAGVASGTRTLKDAINEAMRDWVTNVRTTHYLLGSALGAHPYPAMVRDFQSVIGQEAREQVLAADGRAAGPPPRLRGRRLERDRPLLRVPRDDVRMVGVEAGGRSGRPATTRRGSLSRGVLRRTPLTPAPLGRVNPPRFAARCCRPGIRHRRAAGHADVPAAGRGRQRAADALRLRRARLPGRRPRARPPSRRGPRRVRTRSGTRRRSPRSTCSARPRASFRRSSPRTRSRGWRAKPPRSAAGRSS